MIIKRPFRLEETCHNTFTLETLYTLQRGSETLATFVL